MNETDSVEDSDVSMGHPDYVHCKNCGGHKSEVGSLSWTRLCATCAKRRVAENLLGLTGHSGPAFHRWRRATAAAVGGVLLDEQPNGD